jgi:hypothetical protein
MDEPVWIYVSIVAVIIALAVVISLFNQNSGHMKEQAFTNSFMSFGPHCDYVCSSSPETINPLKVDLPAGARFYTTGQKICGTFNNESRCAACACNLSRYELDLNTTLYDIRTFTCSFKRGEHEISIDCQG